MSRDLNVDYIKKLWILDLILQTGSFKKAALQAKVTPSAISQTLTSLEQANGKPLVIRDKGTIFPTAEAQAILSIVRPAFEAFEKLKSLNNIHVPTIAWTNFGTFESMGIEILPGLVNCFREKLPTAKIGVRIARSSQLLTMVRKGELCSALIAESDNLEKFYKREVYEERLGFYVSSQHSISKLGWNAINSIGVGSLAPCKEGLPRYFTKFLKLLHPTKPFVLCESFEILRSAAVAGTLVAILPERIAKRSPDLVEIFPPNSSNFKEQSRHKLYVVSLASCDREETDFLAEEISNLLKINRH